MTADDALGPDVLADGAITALERSLMRVLSLRKGESKTGLILLSDCRCEADFRLSVILPCGQVIRAGVYSGIRSARIESIRRLTKDFQPPADPLPSLPQGEELNEGSQLQRRVLNPQAIEAAKSMPFSTPGYREFD